jgi:hypothetical protein
MWFVLTSAKRLFLVPELLVQAFSEQAPDSFLRTVADKMRHGRNGLAARMKNLNLRASETILL